MSVRKSLTWAFFGQFASVLISFAGTVFVARLLSPREVGVYGIAVATAGLISIVATMGVGSYLVREVDLTEATRASAFTVNAIINIGISILIFATSFFGAHYFDSPNVGPVLRLLSIPPLLGIFEFLPGTMVRRNMEFKIVSLLQIWGTLLNAVLTVVLAFKGFSSLSFPYATIIVSASRVALLLLLVPDYCSLKVSLRDWRPMLAFGVRMITISGVAEITQRLSEIILGAVLGLAELGIYTRASSLASLMFFNLYGTATTVVFSQLSKVFRETGVIRDTFLRGLEMILALMWPLLIGLAILSRPIIHVLYGSKWDGAAIPFSLLLVAQFLVLSFGMNWELFVLRDLTAQQTKYEVSRSVAGLGFFSIGCFFGLATAAIGRIADAAVGAIIYLPKMARLADAKRSEFTEIYLKSGALTVAAASPSLVLMIASGWSQKTPFSMVVISVLLGVALWAATLKFLDHSLLGEIKQFFSDRS